MSNLKISQLPLYTGNTSGSFLVMNNSGETTTYKVNSNTFLNGIATTSSNTFNGNQTITGSLYVSSSASTSVFVSGSILVQKPQGTVLVGGVSLPSITILSGSNSSLLGRGTLSLSNNNDSIYLVATSTTGSKTQIQSIDNTNTTQTIIELPCSSSWNGGLTKFKYPVEITGSLNVVGSVNKFQGDVEITGSNTGAANRALAVSGSAYVARTLFVGNSSVQPAGGVIIAQANSPQIYASGSDAASIYAQARPTGSTGTTVNIGMSASGSNSVSLFTNTGTFLQIMSGSVTEPIQLLRTTNITGSVNISTVMTLAQQSPLPTGIVGSLAVSGSNLFYHNGSSWSQIN